MPLSVLSSVCAILLRLVSTSPLYAIGTGIILFMASVVGSYIAYRVTREYLSNKVAEANRMALRLAVYSSAVSSRSTAFPVDSRKDLYPNSWQYVACCACVTLQCQVEPIDSPRRTIPQSAIVIIGLLASYPRSSSSNY